MKLKDLIKPKIKVKIPKKLKKSGEERGLFIITDDNKMCKNCGHNRFVYNTKSGRFRCSKCKIERKFDKKYINSIGNAKKKWDEYIKLKSGD